MPECRPASIRGEMATVSDSWDFAINIGMPEDQSGYTNRTVRRVLSLAMVALFFSGFAASRLLAGQASHENHQGGGPVPREILERPVPLRQGIGSVHEAVSTSSPEAQAFY